VVNFRLARHAINHALRHTPRQQAAIPTSPIAQFPNVGSVSPARHVPLVGLGRGEFTGLARGPRKSLGLMDYLLRAF